MTRRSRSLLSRRASYVYYRTRLLSRRASLRVGLPMPF